MESIVQAGVIKSPIGAWHAATAFGRSTLLIQKATMKLTYFLPAMALSIGALASVPTTVAAQAQDMQAARADNVRDTDALRARISTVQARIDEGVSSRKVTRKQARQLARKVTGLQSGMLRLNRQQGFVSAAELASYTRTLGEVDVALDGYGVPRSYGNDGLIAPAASH